MEGPKGDDDVVTAGGWQWRGRRSRRQLLRPTAAGLLLLVMVGVLGLGGGGDDGWAITAIADGSKLSVSAFFGRRRRRPTPKIGSCRVITKLTHSRSRKLRSFLRWGKERFVPNGAVGRDGRKQNIIVLRRTCLVVGRPEQWEQQLRKCDDKARSECQLKAPSEGGAEHTFVYEVAEADRNWVHTAFLRRPDRVPDGGSFANTTIFIDCQKKTPWDKRKDPCHGGPEIRYDHQSERFYHFASALLDIPEFKRNDAHLESQIEYRGMACSNTLKDGAIMWQDGSLELRCPQHPSFEGQVVSAIRNGARIGHESYDMRNDLLFPRIEGQCQLKRDPAPPSSDGEINEFSKLRIGRGFPRVETIFLPPHLPLHMTFTATTELFPFIPQREARPAERKEQPRRVVHMKLLPKSSLLPLFLSERKKREPLVGENSLLVTLPCRSGNNVQDMNRCLNKLRAEIGVADFVYVSSGDSESLANAIAGLTRDGIDEKLRFIIQGDWRLQDPTLEARPSAIQPNLEHRLATALWQSYMKLRSPFFKVKSHPGATETTQCLGLTARFDPHYWNLNAKKDDFAAMLDTSHGALEADQTDCKLELDATYVGIFCPDYTNDIARNIERFEFVRPRGYKTTRPAELSPLTEHPNEEGNEEESSGAANELGSSLHIICGGFPAGSQVITHDRQVVIFMDTATQLRSTKAQWLV